MERTWRKGNCLQVVLITLKPLLWLQNAVNIADTDNFKNITMITKCVNIADTSFFLFGTVRSLFTYSWRIFCDCFGVFRSYKMGIQMHIRSCFPTWWIYLTAFCWMKRSYFYARYLPNSLSHFLFVPRCTFTPIFMFFCRIHLRFSLITRPSENRLTITLSVRTTLGHW